MKNKRFLPSLMVMTVSTTIFITGAGAAVISVNYDITNGSTPVMSVTDAAGVVLSTNWNNVVNRNHAITFINGSGTSTSLGVSVSGGGQDSWNRLDPVAGRIFSDKITMGVVGIINLTTVPYALYDVYVYLSDWGSEVVNFSLDGGATTVATLTNATGGFDGAYVANDNYVKLSGLTGDSSIRMAATSGEVHVGAFQIVQVPEPSSALLGGLGMIVLLRRKRI